MKRTNAVICFSALVLLSSVLAIANSVAFSFGGIIDAALAQGNQNVDSEKVWSNKIDICPDSSYLDSVPIESKQCAG